MPHLQFILGSTREGRKGDKVAQWVVEVAKNRSDFTSELLDLKEWNLPMFNDPISPSGGKYSYDYTKKWSEKISQGDGYLFITPEYNHGYSAALKNALDHLYSEWNKKPGAFVSYGGISGGTRAVEQLRLVLIELQMVPVRSGVFIPFIRDALDANGTPKNKEILEKQLNGTFDQLAWWAELLREAREKEGKK